MMRYSLTLLGIFISFLAAAQDFTVTPTQLNFGAVTELAADSLPVTINNNSTHDLTITGYRFYTTYGSPAFSCITPFPFIAAGSSAIIYVRFQPRHNIFHNSELLIENNGRRGALRVDLNAQGRYSNNYYNASENLEQEALKLGLKNLTGNGYVNLIYGPARDTMFMEIDNQLANGQGATQNTIECVYTGRQAVGYTDRTDCQTNFSFNTEHTFPQGFFNSLEPMRSDLHHLFPTDDLANNARGSLPFGTVSNPTWSQGGSKGNSSTFEPRDAHKGRAARAMLYFLTRYQNYQSFVTTADESYLKSWHQQFLPNAVETARNNRIYVAQENRNPFIDYPQFVERISSFINTASAPVNYSLDLENDSIIMGFLNPSNSEYYRFWIVNNGNQPVNLSNFNFSIPFSFAFANGTGNAVTLQPGEATNLDIQNGMIPPGQLFQADLTFTRTFGTSAQITVPVLATISFTGTAEINSDQYKVYPNPFQESICIDGLTTAVEMQLMDLSGRVLVKGVGNCMDTPELPAGTYILKINHSGIIHHSVVIKN
jgi:hypothetical protein